MIAENAALKDQVAELRQQLEWLKRQVFGQKTERYIPADENQTSLALDVPESDLPEKQKRLLTTVRSRRTIPRMAARTSLSIFPVMKS